MNTIARATLRAIGVTPVNPLNIKEGNAYILYNARSYTQISRFVVTREPFLVDGGLGVTDLVFEVTGPPDGTTSRLHVGWFAFDMEPDDEASDFSFVLFPADQSPQTGHVPNWERLGEIIEAMGPSGSRLV